MSIPQARIAIITITYNSQDFIQDYLNSILTTITQSHYQLVIVDNASTDNTSQIIKSFVEQHQLSKQVNLVELESNIGFGKGCNAGAEYARKLEPSHLWFLNPDTQIYDNTGDILLQHLIQNSNAHFAGSILSDKQGKLRPGSFRFPGLINTALSQIKLGFIDRLFSKYTTAEPIQKSPYRADWLTGASFMVIADSFYTLEGFDPYYFLYFEEVDLFFRAHKYGFTAWTCPKSNVFHISGASTGMNNHKKAIARRPSYWFDSRQYFYRKNYGVVYSLIVDFSLVMCHLFWRVRSMIQKKEDDTPPYFLRDIITHSIIGRLFWKK